MKKEIDTQLSAIKEVMVEKKKECRKVVFESIDIIKINHPSYAEYIQEEFKNMCKELGIDFYAEIRISNEDIEEHLDKL